MATRKHNPATVRARRIQKAILKDIEEDIGLVPGNEPGTYTVLASAVLSGYRDFSDIMDIQQDGVALWTARSMLEVCSHTPAQLLGWADWFAAQAHVLRKAAVFYAENPDCNTQDIVNHLDAGME